MLHGTEMDEGISCPIPTQGEGTGDADVAFSELFGDFIICGLTLQV